ncbi:MAG: response regulator transcription factor [Cytophagaceae bacterium]|nr:MAG: response regulator transcription factor [Cytophagaceae bacterium]
MNTTVAIVDDHQLLAQALANLVSRFEAYTVLFCAENGHDMFRQFAEKGIPEIVLLDVHMPGMNGTETASAIRDQYPAVKVLALSMFDDEQNVVQMMQNGARGYLLKASKPDELLQALNDIRDQGLYNTSFLTERLLTKLNRPIPAPPQPGPIIKLNERELTFVKMACSELTYAEIADRMCVSARTVDGYRESVFEKLNVRTRVGLVMLAIRMGLVQN